MKALRSVMVLLNLIRSVVGLLNLIRLGGDALGTAREVGLRSGVYMLLVVVAGSVALFAPILVAVVIATALGWILDAIGLDQGQSAWLTGTIVAIGVVGGMLWAPNVMYRATRPLSALSDVTGLDDDAEFFEEAHESEEDPPPEIDPAWLRAIDARLAVPEKTPAVDAGAGQGRGLSRVRRTARRVNSRLRHRP
jgi:hypothetical protein